MAIKLSYNSLEWGPTPDMTRMLDEIKRAGWDGWEVRQPLDWLGSAERVRELTEQAGLTVSCVCGVGYTADGDRVPIETNKRRIDLAVALRADTFMFMAPRRPSHRAPTAAEYTAIYAVAKELSDYATERGVDAVFHPHTGLAVQSRYEWESMLDKATNAKLCADVMHMALLGDDPIKCMTDYKDRLAYIHLQDWKDWRFVEMGDGNVLDWKKILGTLDQLGYNRWATCHGGVTDVAPRDKAARCREYLRTIGY